MKRLYVLLLLLLPLCLVSAVAAEVSWPIGCVEANGARGDLTLTCVPDQWQGALVVYAHGYVPPQFPLALPTEELTVEYQGMETTVPALLMQQGFAFATSSYSKNGYAVEQGGADLNALVASFKAVYPAAGPILIVGASEGALIATMLLERYPQVYAGGMAIAGPLAGMPYQIKYLGNFRVVFDYFFPSLLPVPFGARDSEDYDLNDWYSFAMTVSGAMTADLDGEGDLTRQLFKVTRAAQDPADLQASTLETALSVLRYSILGKNDLLDTADGQPFSNRRTWYRGADRNLQLNLLVERVNSDKAAVRYVQKFYQPTGRLQRPLVSIHNTADGIVPFRHEVLYWLRTLAAGSAKHLTVIPVPRYGHAALTAEELLGAFSLLVAKIGMLQP